MDVCVLSTTLKEEAFLDAMEEFRRKGMERGHGCSLVRYGELGLSLDSGEGCRLWGEGAVELLRADLVIPRLSLRRLSRGDLYLLDVLEERGIAFLNPISAWEEARNKITSLQRLGQGGLTVPRTMLVRQYEHLEEARNRLGPPPWIVKPSMGSKGRDILLARSPSQLRSIFEMRWAEDRHEILLVQEFIRCSHDRQWDVRVFCLLHEVLGSMRRICQPGDFRANFSLGAQIEPYPADDLLRHFALRAAEILDLDMAGVDVMFTAAGPVVIEVNANPGWDGISRTLNNQRPDFHDRFWSILEDRFGK